jgi:LAO/AO transport system kinase
VSGARCASGSLGSVPDVSSTSGSDLGERLRQRDLSAAPEVLNLVENRAPARRGEIAALLAGVSAHVVGVTGPPGAGK